jgi:hypothetical protein
MFFKSSGSFAPHTPSAWRSLEIYVAPRWLPRAARGRPPTAPGDRLRALARCRNPGGVRGIFKVRKLSPALFGVIKNYHFERNFAKCVILRAAQIRGGVYHLLWAAAERLFPCVGPEVGNSRPDAVLFSRFRSR